jgi:hypothetical protein
MRNILTNSAFFCILATVSAPYFLTNGEDRQNGKWVLSRIRHN